MTGGKPVIFSPRQRDAQSLMVRSTMPMHTPGASPPTLATPCLLSDNGRNPMPGKDLQPIFISWHMLCV